MHSQVSETLCSRLWYLEKLLGPLLKISDTRSSNHEKAHQFHQCSIETSLIVTTIMPLGILYGERKCHYLSSYQLLRVSQILAIQSYLWLLPPKFQDHKGPIILKQLESHDINMVQDLRVLGLKVLTTFFFQ